MVITGIYVRLVPGFLRRMLPPVLVLLLPLNPLPYLSWGLAPHHGPWSLQGEWVEA